ncbi:hypothetical protein ACFX14_029441 [Malus domestica]
MGRDSTKIRNQRSNGKRKPKIGWAETQSRSEIKDRVGKEKPRSDGQRPNQDRESKIKWEKKPKIKWAKTQSRSKI